MLRNLMALGDQAFVAEFPDESAAIGFARSLRVAEPPWLQDVVPAYARVGIYFDPQLASLVEVRDFLNRFKAAAQTQQEGKIFLVPCCYDLGLDLTRVAEATKCTPDEIIRLHTSIDYTVYAIGFTPGFPYLGYLPSALQGVPRLGTPRLRVEPGSVGMTGKQTGIYPLARPGGWNIIGRTPLVLVDLEAGFFPLQVGDRIRFQAINSDEFSRRNGEQLSKKS